MAKSTYLDNAVLNAVLTASTYTSPSTVYVALYTATPGPGGGGTEVSTSGTGYQRTAMTFSTSTTATTSNSADCTFAVALSGWGTIGYFGLFDNQTAGNLLYYGSLTASKTINTGDQLKFASTGLTVTES